jgi:hypothetical protein
MFFPRDAGKTTLFRRKSATGHGPQLGAMQPQARDDGESAPEKSKGQRTVWSVAHVGHRSKGLRDGKEYAAVTDRYQRSPICGGVEVIGDGGDAVCFLGGDNGRGKQQTYHSNRALSAFRCDWWKRERTGVAAV